MILRNEIVQTAAATVIVNHLMGSFQCVFEFGEPLLDCRSGFVAVVWVSEESSEVFGWSLTGFELFSAANSLPLALARDIDAGFL